MIKSTAIALLSLGILAGVAPRASADEWDQKIYFTFSGPVEIPNQTLQAGTYEFKLASSASDRDIVQVFSKDESHLYGTFLTVPEVRPEPADGPTVTFEERKSDSPEAVKTWFYPGEETGHEFIYR